MLVLQPPACTAVVTIPPMREELLPDAKRVKLSPTPRPLVPSTSQVLNLSEVTAVRQLITGEKPSTEAKGTGGEGAWEALPANHKGEVGPWYSFMHLCFIGFCQGWCLPSLQATESQQPSYREQQTSWKLCWPRIPQVQYSAGPSAVSFILFQTHTTVNTQIVCFYAHSVLFLSLYSVCFASRN